jgi:hypothetical protein
MKLTDKQKKMLWIAAALLVAVHYAPGIFNRVRQQSAAYHAGQGKPSPAITAPDRASSTLAPAAPVAPAPPPSPEEVQSAQLAASLGIWGGSVPRPNLGMCALRLELKPGTDKPGYLGYSTMSCANLQQFRPGHRSDPKNANDAMLDSVPVNAILSGEAKNGSIELVQDKAIGYSRTGCNVIRISLTPFAEHLGATWTEGPENWKEAGAVNHCGGGQVMLSRSKTF